MSCVIAPVAHTLLIVLILRIVLLVLFLRVGEAATLTEAPGIPILRAIAAIHKDFVSFIRTRILCDLL